METLILNAQSITHLIEYREQNNLMHHEADILNEIITAANNEKHAELDWFAGFGDSVTSIIMNFYLSKRDLVWLYRHFF